MERKEGSWLEWRDSGGKEAWRCGYEVGVESELVVCAVAWGLSGPQVYKGVLPSPPLGSVVVLIF